jgi:hypothetical protein
MKSVYRPYLILLGSALGIGLCFAFYRVTGLRNPTFFTDVFLLRKAAELVCFVAFVCFGIQLVEGFLRLVLLLFNSERKG